MSRLITTAAAIALLSAAAAANAQSVSRAEPAIAAQGNAALSVMQADLVADLPLTVSLPQLNAQPAETVELGYLIAAQGDAALEQVVRDLPDTIQADLDLPELNGTMRMAEASAAPQAQTDI